MSEGGDMRNAKNIKPIPGFKKIYPLNGYKIKEIPILGKYISFKRLKENVDKKNIVFVSPKLWEDPFEQIYYRANYEKYSYKKPNIFCMCLTGKPTQNEAAAWKIYQDGREKMVQIVFNVKEMLEQLDQYCLDNGLSIYIGEMKYDFSQKEIATLYKKNSKSHEDYFPDNFDDANFLNLMLLKRRAFEFENEVRIFVISNNGNTDDLYRIPFDYEAVCNLKIAPLPLKSPRQQDYGKLQKKDELNYKKKLKKLFPTLDPKQFQQSHLYELRNFVVVEK